MTSPKVRIYELSKAVGLPNKDIMAILEKEFGETPKSHSSSIDQKLADKVIAYLKKGGKSEPKPEITPARPEPVLIKRKDIEARKAKEAGIELPSEPEPKKEETPTPPPAKAPVEPVAKAESAKVTPAKEEKPVPQAPKEESKKPAPAKEEPKKAEPVQAEAKPKAHPKKSEPTKAEKQPVKETEPVEANEQPTRQVPPGRRPAAPPPRRPMPQQNTPMSQRTSSNRKTKRQMQAEKMAAIRQQKEEEAALANAPKIVSLSEPLTVSELSAKLRLRETELIKHLFMQGRMVTVNQMLDVPFAREIAKEFEFEIEEELEEATRSDETAQYTGMDMDGKKALDVNHYKNLQPRPPVISIMGHVDHGKTTLLDAIRETRHKIVDTEAGGITQSIGAYTVEKNGQKIVFLDTPGHEAFTSMRMRGAKSTDVAILVVAADDGVMPQTIEAINHAKAAQIPIIIAVNKIDKEDADPDRVLVQLSEHGLTSEKWGGDTLTVEVSALQRMGLDELLDQILLVAELLEPKADPTVPAEGVIIEAQLDKRMGPVATALVQNGTMRVGDNVLIGPVGGRVRALIADDGSRIKEAGPSMPVEIIGLDSVPKAGDTFKVLTDDKTFKQMLQSERNRDREQRLSATRAGGGSMLSSIGNQEKELQMNVIVKADTQGSVEAVTDMLRRMSTEEIKVNVLHSGTGAISEADVMLAAAGHAMILGFNTNESPSAAALAEQQGVTIKLYDVIYHINEEMEKIMLGQLSPDVEEVEAGRAEVRQVFKVGKSGVVAGCMVLDGKVIRNAKAVVLRDDKEIYTGKVDNLKRFKDDAKEVASGFECGISFDKFNDLQEGDIIAVYTVKELQRTSL